MKQGALCAGAKKIQRHFRTNNLRIIQFDLEFVFEQRQRTASSSKVLWQFRKKQWESSIHYEIRFQIQCVRCGANRDKFSDEIGWVLAVFSIYFIPGEWSRFVSWAFRKLIAITVFQVVFAVSWPIPYKNPMRKLFFNIGFQFNYMEPFRLSSFYNATYFKNPFNNRNFKSDEAASENDVDTSTQDAMNEHHISDFSAGNETMRTPKSINTRSSEQRYPYEHTNHNNELIGTDLTAAQLYEGIEEHLTK